MGLHGFKRWRVQEVPPFSAFLSLLFTSLLIGSFALLLEVKSHGRRTRSNGPIMVVASNVLRTLPLR